MKKLTPYKNDYGHMRVDCPFCGYNAKYRESDKSRNKDPLRDLKRHITNAAKNEALVFAIENETRVTARSIPESLQHLKYYSLHTSDTVTMKVAKRVYDSDLTI